MKYYVIFIDFFENFFLPWDKINTTMVFLEQLGMKVLEEWAVWESHTGPDQGMSYQLCGE